MEERLRSDPTTDCFILRRALRSGPQGRLETPVSKDAPAHCRNPVTPGAEMRHKKRHAQMTLWKGKR